MKESVTIAVPAGGLVVLLGIASSWAASTHCSSEPTWTYEGIVASDSVKMKHLTVVHDPLGLAGVSGSPAFMMWWSPSSSTPDQLYGKTSSDGRTWGASSHLTVNYAGTQVPVYHPEVIYDRLGFDEKKSTGDVHFKMWFYDGGYEGSGSYNWIRYAESADGVTWQGYEDSPDAASAGKNYLEFSGGSGNEMSVLYRRGGTGIVVDGVDREYVGYQGVGIVGVSTDGAYFATKTGQGGGPTDVCREMIVAQAGDLAPYRAWDDLPGDGNVTSWDSPGGLDWSSTEAGDAPISGASWTDFYGAMSVVAVGNEYWMYDTMDGDNYSVGLLTAPIPGAQTVIPEPATIAAVGLAVAGLGGYVRRRRKA